MLVVGFNTRRSDSHRCSGRVVIRGDDISLAVVGIACRAAIGLEDDAAARLVTGLKLSTP